MSEEAGDAFLDKEVEKGEIAKCVRKLKINKTGGSDGIVGELLKYGGSGMVDLLEQLFSVIWQEEIVPRQWRDGLIVNIFKKGDREDPGNYRVITLLSVVGKVFNELTQGGKCIGRLLMVERICGMSIVDYVRR